MGILQLERRLKIGLSGAPESKFTNMKRKAYSAFLVLISIVLFNGCVAIPPLINVQHREANPDTGKRLDDIDKRLQRIEDKLEKSEKR